jgi:hypothetical protein
VPDHFHAQVHPEADLESFRTRYDQMCYAFQELDRIAEYTTDLIDNAGECGDFEQAYRNYVLARTYGNLADNARNIVRNGAQAPADRAPLYRAQKQFGSLWTFAATRAAEKIAEEGPRGFLFDVAPCTQGDRCEYRPGAWVVTTSGDFIAPHSDSPAFAAHEWREAWECYAETARDWADESDEAYNSAQTELDQDGDWQSGSDRAIVDSILADVHWPIQTGHSMIIHANDGSTVTFELSFDHDAEPMTETERDTPSPAPSSRTVSQHSRPSGQGCRWSGTGVTDAYNLPGCPDECPDSTVTRT